ncbi:hypothetical protein Y032_0638g973 [Ancylostoma ceylanicum]|nr:hypothetical protein Y032_0638g973 [Ancylostoma ceylanicum]
MLLLKLSPRKKVFSARTTTPPYRTIPGDLYPVWQTSLFEIFCKRFGLSCRWSSQWSRFLGAIRWCGGSICHHYVEVSDQPIGASCVACTEADHSFAASIINYYFEGPDVIADADSSPVDISPVLDASVAWPSRMSRHQVRFRSRSTSLVSRAESCPGCAPPASYFRGDVVPLQLSSQIDTSHIKFVDHRFHLGRAVGYQYGIICEAESRCEQLWRYRISLPHFSFDGNFSPLLFPIFSRLQRNFFETTRRHPVSKPIGYDYDSNDRENDLECFSEDLSSSDYSEIQQTQRTITLGDYLFYEQPSTSTKTVRKNHGDSELSCSCENTSVKPPALIDVSEATKSTHIFEIVDVKVNDMYGADLRQQITPLVPGYCTLQWFGEKRACVKTKPTFKLFFALFFEIGSDRRTLTIRINTNTPFSADFSRVDLLKMLAKRRKFKLLFSDLLKFVLETIETEPRQHENNRNRETKKRFLPETNSERLAVKATRACEHDQIAFIEPHYTFEDFDIASSVEENLAICCRCTSNFKIDLFLTLYGTMCRQCIASYVVHQLRLSRFPLQIPLVSATGNSSIDLLYAILPRSVVSLIIKKSYAHFYTIHHPEAVFTKCPWCSVPFVLSERSEFNACTCAECGCFWCYLCNSEPHWPMNCGEFREWKKKWDAQYFFEKFNLDEGERLLRISCCCDRIFYAPENSAHKAICPNKRCKGRFEQEGLITAAYLFRWKFWARYRKEEHKRGDKGGWSITTEYLEPEKLISKEFAKVKSFTTM